MNLVGIMFYYLVIISTCTWLSFLSAAQKRNIIKVVVDFSAVNVDETRMESFEWRRPFVGVVARFIAL